jgi:hypothetical protein
MARVPDRGTRHGDSKGTGDGSVERRATLDSSVAKDTRKPLGSSLRIRPSSDVREAEIVDRIAGVKPAPTLQSLEVRISDDTIQRFDGIPYAPLNPAFIAYYRLVGDPVEYWLDDIPARNAREARSIALAALREKGINIDSA